MYWRYKIIQQSLSLLSPETQLELQVFLKKEDVLSSKYSELLKETDEVYIVTHQSRIVACVFSKAVDWCPAPKPNLVKSPEDSHAEACNNEMLKICNLRALLVAPCHRRLGIASALVQHVQRKEFADKRLWIELHVDEKQDKSHNWLLCMYRKLGFIVLPRAQRNEYLLLCVNHE